MTRSVTTNESDPTINDNIEGTITATSLRMFRHPDTHSQQDDTHNNNNNNDNDNQQRTQNVHSVNVLSSDLQECHTGNDIVQQPVRLAATY